LIAFGKARFRWRTDDALQRLVAAIEADGGRFLAKASDAKATFRGVHDALRRVWLLAHEEDRHVGQLRARILNLPSRAFRRMEGRAHRLIPRLFSGETMADGFRNWVACAPSDRLIELAAIASATGARIVAGRGRGGGRRSRPRLEPLILGTVRGAGDPMVARSGRPRQSRRDQLVAHLALSWLTHTGHMPSGGRSDRTGFGDLVHCVFDWLEEPGADQTLRRFWSGVRQRRAGP
jgi:hypothetical protein